jgi:hypothetical protein
VPTQKGVYRHEVANKVLTLGRNQFGRDHKLLNLNGLGQNLSRIIVNFDHVGDGFNQRGHVENGPHHDHQQDELNKRKDAPPRPLNLCAHQELAKHSLFLWIERWRYVSQLVELWSCGGGSKEHVTIMLGISSNPPIKKQIF